MLRSVRFRLTCWYVGILALVLIGLSAGVYMRLAQESYSKIDRDLDAAINVLTQSIVHEFAEHGRKDAAEVSLRSVFEMVYRESFPAGALAVFDGTRQVAVKPGADGLVPDPPSESTGTTRYRTVETRAGPWRVADIKLAPAKGAEYTFVAETNLAPVISDLKSLQRAFFLAIPLALAVTAIAGYLLARKSLAPVVMMAETANRISSRDLSQRIAGTETQDELGTLAATLNRLLDRIEQSFEHQKQFMANSSHELRTPIYVAHTAAEVTLGAPGRSESEYREALATIDQQLMRLSRIVEDMFTLALADAGAYQPEQSDFYLDEVIAETVRAARILAERKQITISAAALPELPFRGDEGLLRQLMLLLLDNAVKYTPDKGKIELVFETRDERQITIDIRDTGPGIPLELQSKIFDRFFRVDKTRSRAIANGGGGAGLGLAIARWIAELHGGTLTLTESGSHGSVFHITLQRTPAPIATPT